MTTILADSFTASLARLTNDEQKQAKLTAFDLQVNPDQPGLQFHRIDKSKDPNFWSLRVSRDLRVIVHKTGDSVMLVYVGHHDDAYHWAERRRIEAHPRTGALQIVEVRERVEQIVEQIPAQASLPLDTPVEPPRQIFAALSSDDLLSVGVPTDWLSDVVGASEDRFFSLIDHLPRDASEALLEYAATGPLVSAPAPVADALTHPDTLRRFRVLEGAEELRAALDAPFEKWAVFLHPSQRSIVDRTFSGPARVAGSAGTGKTVVALHRVFRTLQNDPNNRVLLTTFSEPLARALRGKLKVLFGERQGLSERVTVASFLDIAAQLVTLNTGHKPHLGLDDTVRSALAKAAAETGITDFMAQFLYSEWTYVIDAWQIDSAKAYAAVPRMGRKNRLGARQRERLWELFAATRKRLADRSLTTNGGVFASAATAYRGREEKPFTHIVVDEAQDLVLPN
jgi:mRNA-degrading endonuclease RelE of RelBE toxin-antitoxin system